MIKVDPPPITSPVVLGKPEKIATPWGIWLAKLTEALNAPQQVLSAGNVGTFTADTYLDIGGVIGSATTGLPMLRSGSITGIGGCLTVNSYTPTATISWEAKVNGGTVFQADWTVDATGVKVWSGTQKAGIDAFSANDLIQIYLDVSGTVSIDNPVAILEIMSSI